MNTLNSYNVEAATDISEDNASGLFAEESLSWSATAWGSGLSPAGSSDVIDGNLLSGEKNCRLVEPLHRHHKNQPVLIKRLKAQPQVEQFP